MARGTVAAAFARGLIDYAASLGVDRDRLLASVAIAPDDLEPPERRVPLDQFVRLTRAARELSGDPAFALHFGEAVDLREMSIVALLGQSMETAMDAFAAVNRYASLDADLETDGPDRFTLVGKGGKLWLVDRRTNPNATPELTESVFARMVSAGRRVGMNIPLREVQVTHPDPGYRHEYERIFAVPVAFDSDWNALAIDPGAMSRPIALQPAYAGRILAERAEALLRDLHSSRSVRGEVEAALRPLLAGGEVTVERIATRLGASRQTLYRRLKAEGTTFEQVLQGLRLELAEASLADRTLSIPEIAFRLGFADGPSFSKAFKRWTGTSPAAWRRGASA